ncbi:MAG: DUF3795 domain-containing protein [Ruminococcus sp.]|nr:DUF3795 domain-containing protein [Ruminococcus sp.]
METISCCGIYCGECPVYAATKKDDENARKFLAHEFSTEERRFYPKDIVCHGCRTVSADHNKFGKSCEIRKCCKEKHIRLCAECGDFPCAKADEYIPKGSEHRNRLEEMAASI